MAVQASDLSAIKDVYFKVWEPYVPFPPNGPNCGPNTTDPLTGAVYTSANPSVPVEAFPAGSEFKFCLEEQHHATPDLEEPRGTPGCTPAVPAVPNDPCNPLQSVPCTQLGGGTAIYGEMFAQAIENGVMTAAEQADIIDKCGQGQKAIFRVVDKLTKDKPCGEVRVEASAVNENGKPFRLANYFDNLCFIHLQLDFTNLDWGTIPSTGNPVIGGDMTYGNAGGGPTVLNTGNAPMYVETMFDPLVPAPITGETMDLSKRLTSFDSKLRASWQPSSLGFEAIDPQPSDQWHCFSTQPIGHDQTGKVDFSLHTIGAQVGHWAGHVYIVARFDCAAPHNGALHANTPAGGH
jgi:hypothetical protein